MTLLTDKLTHITCKQLAILLYFLLLLLLLPRQLIDVLEKDDSSLLIHSLTFDLSLFHSIVNELLNLNIFPLLLLNRFVRFVTVPIGRWCETKI